MAATLTPISSREKLAAMAFEPVDQASAVEAAEKAAAAAGALSAPGGKGNGWWNNMKTPKPGVSGNVPPKRRIGRFGFGGPKSMLPPTLSDSMEDESRHSNNQQKGKLPTLDMSRHT
uniref:Uncharacterized protein n=1 Tax=Craspedostauros australis TaxID=1486917 RepID=A0A7R9WVY5_9STRA|eukprot:CAMPEP_0198128634 /NCGR_PEP_ID=MMETSP1442-20131203/49804_1 /TAXON_ID= /ORGANISM="Craspedostauros australis, Strain CCMP3328" /LENGTH=116 /DNA_ID=CAMNT_0043788835 /DNA_START=12 /DNA_END=362 /DNA_ORIENTATION=-